MDPILNLTGKVAAGTAAKVLAIAKDIDSNTPVLQLDASVVIIWPGALLKPPTYRRFVSLASLFFLLFVFSPFSSSFFRIMF